MRYRPFASTSNEPGAIPISAMRHPAAPPAAIGIPNPDDDTASAIWAA
ncbi:hypothetical protein [Streptomyces mirabilis]